MKQVETERHNVKLMVVVLIKYLRMGYILPAFIFTYKAVSSWVSRHLDGSLDNKPRGNK